MSDYSLSTPGQEQIQIDSTIIDLQTIDTSLYSDKYKFWQEIDVSDADFRPVVIGDVNKNGRAEIYGYTKSFEMPQGQPISIFELDTAGFFKKVYQYPDTMWFAQTIFDVEKNGNQELLMYGNASNGYVEGFAFRPPSSGKLPTAFAYWYSREFGHAQINHPMLGDFDKDGKTDVVYNSSPSVLSLFIDEFNPITNSFDSVYKWDVNKYIDGHSTGDFDMDGKTDIVLGSSDGDVYVVEAQGPGLYQKVWQSTVATHNAYLHFSTNDIDGNGKPEFWVGGDAYYNGVGITRFTCFETNGDNSYVPVARIDLVGVFSFFAGNCFAEDIDKDGKEELFICIDQNVLILKFVGSPNHHKYEIFYFTRNELQDQNCVYSGATLFDAENQGKDDLFITLAQVNNVGRKDFTYSYKPTFSTGVKTISNSSPSEFRLYQNYPNPFNPTTTISFTLPSRTFVSLKIFDMLGKEVSTIVSAELQAGSYSQQWHPERISSGIYFYKLQAGAYSNTKKLLLLK